MRFFLFSFFILLSLFAYSQKTITITGNIFDEDNKPLSFVRIHETFTQKTYVSDENGSFKIKGKIKTPLDLEFQFLGFKKTIVRIQKDLPGTYQVNITMIRDTRSLPQVTIKQEILKNDNFFYLNPEISQVLPNASGSFESYLKTFPGVSSNNELSSQYSVRGGNFDENLVYVNEIEIFRPFLVQQGQQEGLSFINPEMVSRIKFSTGGFGVEYGDKTSSVLDINYKRPSEKEGSAMASLLGASFNFEYANPNQKLGVLLGFRERSNQFLLKTLDVHGNYKPLFADLQALIQYKISPKTLISFLGYGAHNSYSLIPTNRSTTFGTLSQVFELDVSMQGEENDFYNSGLAAIKIEMEPHKNLRLKWMGSYYKSNESENKDIQGDYYFNNLELNPGAPVNSKSTIIKGIGEYGEFANNSLLFSNLNLEHKGNFRLKKQSISWGLKYSHEIIQNQVNEYNYNDTLPLNYTGYIPKINYQDSFVQNHSLNLNKLAFYGEDGFELGKRIHVEAGIRFSYLDYNQEWLKSPRILIAYRPPVEADWVLRFAYGLYYQSPIFNELFSYNGTLSPKRPAQKSVQYNFSSDLKFNGLGTEMDFVSEIYYKDLKNLIPYQINDVRIDYLGSLNSKGYAYGLNLRLSGRLVTNLESSLSISLQKTEEIISGYNYPIDSVHKTSVPVGYLPRPTDQRFNLALFFQDKLVGDPTSKVHLSLIYGSNLPIGPPDHQPYEDVFRAPAYRRVDIGFSKEFISPFLHPDRKFPGLKSLIAYAEIFNLLNIDNTISYFWIRDNNGNRFAVPNYLTGRILNLKLVARF